MIKLKDILSEGTLTEANEVTIKIGPETVYWGVLKDVTRLINFHAGRGKNVNFVIAPEIRSALGSTFSKRLDDQLHALISDHER